LLPRLLLLHRVVLLRSLVLLLGLRCDADVTRCDRDASNWARPL
jgi:hypothetical protein